MAGILEFTLGLESGEFLRGMGESAHKLLEFMAIGESLNAAFERVWKQIERGAQLRELSARTGETVSNLVQLQHGFEMAGVSGEDVGHMLLHLQRAMGGVSEEGQSTAHLFGALHLRISDLRRLDAPAQLNAIAHALAGVNQSQATAISTAFFGREGAGNFLQIAHSAEEFEEGLRGASQQAALFERNAAAFRRIADAWHSFTFGVQGFWAGIASGAAPAIASIEHQLNRINFSTIGERLGTAIAGVFGAFQQGHGFELISDGILLSLQTAVALAPPILSKLGLMLLEVFQAPLAWFEAGIERIIHRLASMVFERGHAPEWAQGQSFDQIYQRNRAAMSAAFGPLGLLGIMNSLVNVDMANRVSQTADRWRDLWDRLSHFADTQHAAVDEAEQQQQITLSMAKHHQVESSAVEKLGFIIGGSRDSTNDYQRQTAEHTRATAAALQTLVHRALASPHNPVNVLGHLLGVQIPNIL